MTSAGLVERIAQAELVRRSGVVRRVMPTWIEADGPVATLGSLCRIEPTGGEPAIHAEVARVDAQALTLVPLAAPTAITPGAKVFAIARDSGLPAGDAFLGRAIDGAAVPIDDGAAIIPNANVAALGTKIAPLDRTSRTKAIETGIRAIDGLMTIATGQRVGIFAASGVGKTSFVAQATRQIDADRVVVCLVGERGREVENFWNTQIPPTVRMRATLVAATSDQPAIVRCRAVRQALALATHWQAQGAHVLFVLDSVTRYAMALREVGLAAGEPPTVRAYTPGVFATLPQIVERCGALKSGGAITALFTVLTETDDGDDPIAEAMKSLLDGHIVLSRALAERGHFPAIDIVRSVSRNAEGHLDDDHRRARRQAIATLATLDAAQTLLDSGLYAGGNPKIDAALGIRPALDDFLQQELDLSLSAKSTRERLIALMRGAG